MQGADQGRLEDVRLLTGQGRYCADFPVSGMAQAGFVRAPVGSGRIAAFDADAVRRLPGVIAVLTARDLAADGIGAITHDPLPRDDGGPAAEYPQPILAGDVIAHVGQCVALVVAESPSDLAAALDEIVLDIDEAPAPTGIAFSRRFGDADRAAAAIEGARHVATVSLDIPRVTAFALEPRMSTVTVEDGAIEYRSSTQNPFALKTALIDQLGLDPDRLRVRAADVGGSFGLKGFMAPEDAALCWAAHRLGRSLAWVPSRSETMLGDAQGRGVGARISVALDADLRIVAIDAAFRVDAGAFPGPRAFGVINNINGLTGVYRIPEAAVSIEGHMSARPPLAPFRGNGRPEVAHAIERALDAAARQIGVDPVELRRRNAIPASELPVTTALDVRIDCGDFARVMEAAARLAGGSDARRAEAEARGRLYGIGVANCIESSGGPLRKPKPDLARLTVRADGSVTLAPGVMSVGQGHETSLSRMAAATLGIDMDRIDYVQGDTDAIPFGRGSGGSSGMAVAGAALAVTLDALIAQGRTDAAAALDCDADALTYRDGAYHLAGSNRSVDLAGIAADHGGEWMVERTFAPSAATFPNGTHVCEVEIDPETGCTRVVRYTAVEDVGRVLNPPLVDGQLHGGIAQGLSIGLGERIAYDGDGQLLTGSLMDYALIRASDMPDLRLDTVEVPTGVNPLGVKGVGEAGTVGSTAALASAVSDALAQVGVEDFDLPATPCRVWEAIASASRTDRP